MGVSVAGLLVTETFSLALAVFQPGGVCQVPWSGILAFEGCRGSTLVRCCVFSLADDVSGGGLDDFRHGVALRRVRCKDKLKKNGREHMVGGFQRVSIGEIQPTLCAIPPIDMRT